MPRIDVYGEPSRERFMDSWLKFCEKSLCCIYDCDDLFRSNVHICIIAFRWDC